MSASSAMLQRRMLERRRTERRVHALVILFLSLGLSQPAAAQHTVLSGRVLDAKTERPIVGAYVELLGAARSIQTDSGGLFQLRDITAGVYDILVRAIGYDSMTAILHVGVRDSVDTDFLMSTISPRLATVRIDAQRPERYGMWLHEFEERRAQGDGKFLDWSYFERNGDRDLGRLLIANIPGIRTRRYQSEEYLVSGRNGRDCRPQLFVNGFLTDDFNLNSVRASDVIGFEYYTVASTPTRFRRSGDGNGGSQCGTALFWIK